MRQTPERYPAELCSAPEGLKSGLDSPILGAGASACSKFKKKSSSGRAFVSLCLNCFKFNQSRTLRNASSDFPVLPAL